MQLQPGCPCSSGEKLEKTRLEVKWGISDVRKPVCKLWGEAAHTLRSTLVLALVGTGNFLLLQFFYNYLCLLPRLPVAFVGVEVSLAETDALRRDLDVLAVSNPFDRLFEG
jgi:hypothetical protein